MSVGLIAIIGIVLAVVMLGLLGLLVYWVATRSSGQNTAINMLAQQLEAIRNSQETLSQTLDKNLQAGQQNVNQHLQSSRQTLDKLHIQIGRLEGSSQQMLQLGTDVRKLQDIFKNPKLRGQLGEKSLAKLLAEILPQGSFKLQHTFKNGRIVDALVNMPDYCVPVDAKFPLPTFEKMVSTQNDDEKTRLRRQFQREVIDRVDEIAENYINPTEGTLDFALMYIPAENVYYETVITYDGDKTNILDYALQKKVIPISPNLLYAYLMTVVMGLRGLQIEKQAGAIRRSLNKLAGSFGDFSLTWSILGKHLRNAQGQYDEGQTKLNKFTMQLDQIQTGSEDG